MSDLKRWVDDSPPDALVGLIRSARGERAPSRVLSRTLIALGTTSTASVVAAASGGVATVSKVAPSLALVVIKWGGAGLLGGSLVAGAMAVVSRAGSSGVEPVPAASVAQPASRATNPSPDLPRGGFAEAPGPELVPEPPAKASAVPMDKRVEATAIETETALIGAAHARLRAGDGTSALELLKSYEEHFEPPHFEPEVLFLRMQALLQRGEQDEARRVAGVIVKRYPTSPGVSRAEALLDSDAGALEK